MRAALRYSRTRICKGQPHLRRPPRPRRRRIRLNAREACRPLTSISERTAVRKRDTSSPTLRSGRRTRRFQRSRRNMLAFRRCEGSLSGRPSMAHRLPTRSMFTAGGDRNQRLSKKRRAACCRSVGGSVPELEHRGLLLDRLNRGDTAAKSTKPRSVGRGPALRSGVTCATPRSGETRDSPAKKPRRKRLRSYRCRAQQVATASLHCPQIRFYRQRAPRCRH